MIKLNERKKQILRKKIQFECKLTDVQTFCFVHQESMIITMQAIEDSGSRDGLLQRIKAAFGKATWKHLLIVVLPLAIYIYPKPIIRLFLPLAAKINRNHPSVTCHGLPRQIILTSSTLLTWEAFTALNSLREIAPNTSSYHREDVAVIELFPGEREASPFSSQVVGSPSESQLLLYCQALWTNYRLCRLERPQLKAVLIKSSQEVLKGFLLRFYKLDRRSSHKVGLVRNSTLTVLRLDERVGTYEHLTCEWDEASLR